MLFVSVAPESVGGGGGDSCWAPVDRQRRRSAPGTGQAGGILWGNGRFRPITGVEF